jgi:hypothetical protein
MSHLSYFTHTSPRVWCCASMCRVDPKEFGHLRVFSHRSYSSVSLCCSNTLPWSAVPTPRPVRSATSCSSAGRPSWSTWSTHIRTPMLPEWQVSSQRLLLSVRISELNVCKAANRSLWLRYLDNNESLAAFNHRLLWSKLAASATNLWKAWNRLFGSLCRCAIPSLVP